MTDSFNPQDHLSLLATIEALLFIAPGPIPLTQIAACLEVAIDEVREGLNALTKQYEDERGLRLQWHAGKVQVTTAPQLAPMIEKFLGLDVSSRLSRAGLETLAILAYKQPITRPQLDSIRGVNSDSVLKSLLSKGLIQEVGRIESPGRPILYGTTSEFLQYFGLNSINELPQMENDDFGKQKETIHSNGKKQLILKE